MGKSRRTIKGTSKKDVLTGSKSKKRIKGYGRDDIIEPGEGMYKVWGGKGKDTFVTTSLAKGHMKIMDMKAGEVIEFCGCRYTDMEQRGKDVWIVLGDDVKAVVKGAKEDMFEMDFENKTITMLSEPAV